jgi:hypothetical protein
LENSASVQQERVSLFGFIKKIFRLVQTTTTAAYRASDRGFPYINLDYARFACMKWSKTRLFKNFSEVQRSYTVSTTKSSSPDVGLLIAQGSKQ